jgi:CubicO group peptidase (beta-lactamase class C family)
MSVLRRAALAVFACLFASLAVHAQMPTSGQPVTAFAPVDTIIENLMTEYSVPGIAFSISYNGKLVYARGYGWADEATNSPVQPDTVMRIASNSKPLTAAGILLLIQQGKITMNTQPFVTVFTDLTPPAGTTYNTELNQITIGELLAHTGGWDDTEVPDPDFEYEDIAPLAFGDAVPATPKELISYMLSQPLQHTPGTTYAYSNLGYIVLGQVISKVTGGNYTSYESWMEANVFKTMGMLHTVAGETFTQQANEAAYADYPGAPLVTNVFDPGSGTEGYSCTPASATCVAFPYGGYSVELNHANGGWVTSSVDLARYVNIMNGQITPALLTSPPTTFTGYVPPVGNGWEYIFYGSLPGTNSITFLDSTGTYGGNLVFSAVINTRNGSNTEEPESDITSQVSAALKNVTSWPTNNLYSVYSGSTSACSFTLGSSSGTAVVGGGTGTVSVTDANYCAWLATSNASWITVTAGSLNSNSGSVSYSVAANTSGSSRMGTITIAGQTFTITQAGPVATSTTVAASPNPATVGQSVTLTATVKKSSGTGSPTGSVTFKTGTTLIGSSNLNGSGVATFAASSNGLPTGSYPITASYGGDANDAVSNSTATTVTLNKAATTTTITANPTSVTPPASVTLTATVKRSASGATGAPTGTVTFYYQTLTVGTAKLNGSGVATLSASTNDIAAGTYPITASYGGDTSDNTSGSSSVTVTVK